MIRWASIILLLAVVAGLVFLVFCHPHYVSDQGNVFLKNFVNHEFLSFLGVIVTITLASAANLHLEFNRIERDTGETFAEARGAIKSYAILLIVMFAGAFALVLLKPVFGGGPMESAAFNAASITVVLLNIMSLADLTLAVFKIRV